MKSPKISNNNNVNSPQNSSSTLYEPTSVLDPHLTSSPAAVAGPLPFHAVPPPVDVAEWDPLVSFFGSNSTIDISNNDGDDELEYNNFIDHLIVDDLPDMDISADRIAIPPPPFDRTHLDLLLKAAAAVESNDASTAHVILSRLNNIINISRPSTNSACRATTALQRAAFHFKDALLSLLPIPNPPTASPAVSSFEIINRITAHKAFSDLSPIPQFTSFTANQTILEALLDSSTAAAPHHHHHQLLHVIDFDIGLGGQWSSFVQEIASRSRSLRTPPPHIRITAAIPDETVETVLAAENLRDFARTVGVHLTVGFVHVGNLGTLALSSVRISPGEAVGVVLTPTIFKLVGNTPESSAALLRFVKQVSPKVVVFVDTECLETYCSGFRRSFASGLEFYSSLIESIDVVAAANLSSDDEVAAVVRGIEEAVLRPRIFGAVAGWAPRETSWWELLAGNGMAAAGFSEFTESQAEWLLRRTAVEGFHVARRDGALVLSWRGRDLAATSAWRC